MTLCGTSIKPPQLLTKNKQFNQSNSNNHLETDPQEAEEVKSMMGFLIHSLIYCLPYINLQPVLIHLLN